MPSFLGWTYTVYTLDEKTCITFSEATNAYLQLMGANLEILNDIGDRDPEDVITELVYGKK